ncbi:hypothetical protein [Mucilaginibacter paludis]|uniref:FAS1 domain-containing protein n=1 Tax=Mucilaginibacter paludis DSM 18603 TaxID=714943 RepID=H1YC18_9SPHI|nr:hypothetical protein [Mucilaginibacter paludis]EHQ29581.1 hypothetical protein Mucpa_5510 [Mucilaginibacter paludis DSM 18603]
MKNFKLYMIACLLAVLGLAGCQKQEFTPPPIGEKVPYQDTLNTTWRQALAQSDAKLFYQAWQRSHMDSLIRTLNTTGQAKFTVLALSDAALQAGGYDAAKIQSMPVRDLDTLLTYYTLRERITPATLAATNENYIAYSLLTRAPLKVTSTTTLNTGATFVPYVYKQYLQLKNGKTYVNGKVAGSGKSATAKDGCIFFLDNMVFKPTKNILQIIQTDPRFSMFLAILTYSDQLANDTITKVGRVMNNRAVPFDKEFSWTPKSTQNYVYFTTAFLPTNDAFIAAGFNTLDDLKKFARRGKPTIVTGTGNNKTLYGFYAIDSLLTYHCYWGMRLYNTGAIFPGSPYTSVYGDYNAPVMYSNILDNSIVQNYVIINSLAYPPATGPNYTYYVPFDFSRNASGNIQMRVKGSEATPATITEADIYTLMGPIHAVDHLLIPKGFKIR